MILMTNHISSIQSSDFIRWGHMLKVQCSPICVHIDSSYCHHMYGYGHTHEHNQIHMEEA